MIEWVQVQMHAAGIGGEYAGLAAALSVIAGVALAAWIADLAARRLLLRAVHFLVARTRSDWDDRLMSAGVFSRAAHLAPALVLYLSGSAFGPARAWIERLALVGVIAVTLRALNALLDALVEIYKTTELSRDKPILGYVQIAKILLWAIGGIFVVAALLQKDPWGLLTGLGAMSAILLLVFRDSILGFVAGLQIALNKMVQRGDWIEIPAYGIDGDVIDISLHTVKVQNFDKTISTVPVQQLVSESFKNWRGMQESGGRRIKRALLIDVDSIRFCDDEMLARFSKIQHIAGYVELKALGSRAVERVPPVRSLPARQRTPAHQHRHVPRLRRGLSAPPPADPPGHDVPGPPARADPRGTAARDLRVLQRSGLGALRGHPGRHFRTTSWRPCASSTCAWPRIPARTI